ncbi:WXG100 family type VII secretion target [Microbacterium murale]|uniref:WXG100 family type VII secretion target n=1 Tax=Microbacterium murale TaxID=1081040 RepID=A0ABU0P9R3_9MICO|nr:WXG100 family type VII secretion target [Microbacterium murale]MDQ0644068.1 WXG100 family type VII secretion target [Microbacterium murale]
MAHFVVSTPSLGFSAASMMNAAGMLDAQIQQAQSVVNAVAGGTWTGDAADAFVEEWNSFITSAGLTRMALLSIATRLHGAQATYETTESQIVTATRSARVSINQPGKDGELGTKDDEKLSVTLAESVGDSREDLTELVAEIKTFTDGGSADV